MCIKEKIRSWWRGLFWHPIEDTLAYHTKLNNEELIGQIENRILSILYAQNQKLDKRIDQNSTDEDRIANKCQEWVLDIYTPEVQKWITNGLLPDIEDWISKHYSKKKSADSQSLKEYIEGQLKKEENIVLTEPNSEGIYKEIEEK